MTDIKLRAACAAWFVLILCGSALLWRHAMTPGPPTEHPELWPGATGLRAAGTIPRLLVVMHPHCPCSAATLTELAALLQESSRRVDTSVIFVRPAEVPAGWEQSATLARARALPGVVVVIDEAGREAARFGVHTSGQALVYRPDGRLAFSGGLTGTRGHAGDNPGRQAALAAIAGAQGPARSPVFGCPVAAQRGETAILADSRKGGIR